MVNFLTNFLIEEPYGFILLLGQLSTVNFSKLTVSKPQSWNSTPGLQTTLCDKDACEKWHGKWVDTMCETGFVFLPKMEHEQHKLCVHGPAAIKQGRTKFLLCCSRCSAPLLTVFSHYRIWMVSFHNSHMAITQHLWNGAFVCNLPKNVGKWKIRAKIVWCELGISRVEILACLIHR